MNEKNECRKYKGLRYRENGFLALFYVVCSPHSIDALQQKRKKENPKQNETKEWVSEWASKQARDWSSNSLLLLIDFSTWVLYNSVVNKV